MGIIERVQALEGAGSGEYDGFIRVLSYDPNEAAARPDAFGSFTQRVRDACPGIGVCLWREPVRPGWVQHWPAEDEELMIRAIVCQDDLEAFLEAMELDGAPEWTPETI